MNFEMEGHFSTRLPEDHQDLRRRTCVTSDRLWQSHDHSPHRELPIPIARKKVLRRGNPLPAQSPSIMPVFQQQPPPSQRSKPNRVTPHPSACKLEGRQGHYAAAAAAAAVMFACSVTVAAAHAAHQIHVAASYSLGTWSTAALSVSRATLAATSLPNVGVAIFAGGLGTFCDVYFRNTIRYR